MKRFLAVAALLVLTPGCLANGDVPSDPWEEVRRGRPAQAPATYADRRIHQRTRR